ncbi:hypothetical protein Aristophanes_00002 [Acinetobacter phage Aristophanes]|uniref:Uncharacterized protein n=1 Tax=Acinetobacter phage Aristophanes TaxID=2759203 RepID=A0A7G9VYL1_BPACA|nr:hypothetical protein Aristophanes_00002 [Acinetobacter phage Aristophanes]
MKLITDNAALAKAIKSIAVRGQKLDHDIHVAGVSCLAHIAEHSNTTLLNDLVNALPKGARKHAFVEWALAYGSVRTLDRANPADADKIAKGQVFALDRSKAFDLDGAVANAWWNFKPEADLLSAFDVHKAVAQLVKRVTKATKDGATLEGVQDALKQLKALEQQLTTSSEVL